MQSKPCFSSLFYQSITKELSAEEKNQLSIKLTQIYGENPQEYKDSADFDLCKSQLLTLLSYIAELDTHKFALFKKYAARVSTLTHESAKPDIEVTMKTVKKNLEEALFNIENNYKKVDKVTLDSYEVEKCFSGASSNIYFVLTYIQSCNSECTLNFFVQDAKMKLIQGKALKFIKELSLNEHPGNEVHYVNALFDAVAEQFGLPLINDPFATQFNNNTIEAFKKYLTQSLTVSSFLHALSTQLPLPPQVTINSDTEGMQHFKALNDFFQLLGYKEANREQYLNLYEETIDDLTFNPQYIPKEGFFEYCLTLLAEYLKQSNLLKDIHFKLKDISFINNDEKLMKINQNGYYELLTDEEIFTCLHQLGKDDYYHQLLHRQLSLKTLFALFQNNDGQKEFYFSLLLERPNLPTDIVNALYQNCPPSSVLSLAHYVFQNGSLLTIEPLKHLATSLSSTQVSDFITQAIKGNSQRHFLALVQAKPENVAFIPPFPLHLAALYNAADLMNLLTLSYDIEQLDNNQLTPLAYTAKKGNIHALIKLHELGADINKANNNGATPAFIAAQNGQVEVLTKLFELGADLNKANNNGATPAFIAAQNGQVEVLAKLHELGADLNKAYNSGATPAWMAAQQGHIAVLAKLHELGADLNKANDNGATPAFIAAQNGQVEVLAKLHELGADLNKANNNGTTPAFIAAQEGHVAVLAKLHELGADLNKADNNGATPALMAAQKGHVAVLAKLYELGADLNKADNNGATPACIAAQEGQVAVLAKLHELGADLNKANNNGATPAWIAAQQGQLAVLAKLHELGADLNKAHNNGATPAFIAAQKGQLAVLAKLHELGADLNKANNNGATPAWMAAQQGQVAVLAKLHELGVNLNQARNNGATLLFLAAQNGHHDAVLYLLKNSDSFHTSFVSSYDEFQKFAEKQNQETQIRMNEVIELKIKSGNSNAIGLLPKEIAYIMGHAQVLASLEAHETLMKPTVVNLSFFSNSKDEDNNRPQSSFRQLNQN